MSESCAYEQCKNYAALFENFSQNSHIPKTQNHYQKDINVTYSNTSLKVIRTINYDQKGLFTGIHFTGESNIHHPVNWCSAKQKRVCYLSFRSNYFGSRMQMTVASIQNNALQSMSPNLKWTTNLLLIRNACSKNWRLCSKGGNTGCDRIADEYETCSTQKGWIW